MRKNYLLPYPTRRIAVIGLLLLTLGCQRDVVEKCYTCTNFIAYATTHPTFNTPSPYTTEKTICDETEKATLEQGSKKVELITGVHSLTTTTRTVCVKRALR